MAMSYNVSPGNPTWDLYEVANTLSYFSGPKNTFWNIELLTFLLGPSLLTRNPLIKPDRRPALLTLYLTPPVAKGGLYSLHMGKKMDAQRHHTHEESKLSV